MKPEGYYSSGEFAKKAKVSLRTVRYYDKQDLLKPSMKIEECRYYTDDDFTRLQQILLLKYLGFSLDEIKEMTTGDTDEKMMLNSLQLQKRLVQERIDQMKLVEQAIDNSISSIETTHQLNGDQMLDLIHLTGMENSLKTQYLNASNISARIRLHRDFSVNKQGWFPWIFEQMALNEGENVLELGCGSGALWLENMNLLPNDIAITLSDISEGMVRDARRSITKQDPVKKDKRFTFQTFACESIPYEDDSFDIVVANHLLFYVDDIKKALTEIRRVLKPGGRFICSTYGSNHMKEITKVVNGFDERIRLSDHNLYEHFGLQTGLPILEEIFSDIECRLYEDKILLNQSEPLIEYILSCHGNQNQYLSSNYTNFKKYVEKEVGDAYEITKEAGIFLCKI